VNSAELVGHGAIWCGEIPDCVHQNHVIRVHADRSKVLPEFLIAVINSGHGRAYFRACAKRTTNLASIGATEAAGLPVPEVLPDRQKELVQSLDAARKAADALREQASPSAPVL
jgi:type I restriction enzyme S subunit